VVRSSFHSGHVRYHSTPGESGSSAACLAHASAFSLPSTPQWLGHHRISIRIPGSLRRSLAICFLAAMAYRCPGSGSSEVILRRASGGAFLRTGSIAEDGQAWSLPSRFVFGSRFIFDDCRGVEVFHRLQQHRFLPSVRMAQGRFEAACKGAGGSHELPSHREQPFTVVELGCRWVEAGFRPEGSSIGGAEGPPVLALAQFLDVVPVSQGAIFLLPLPPQLGSENGSGLNACRLNSAAVL